MAKKVSVHKHVFIDVVRVKGDNVRRQCVCRYIGPWERDDLLPPLDTKQDEELVEDD